jgi:hypothetical protein
MEGTGMFVVSIFNDGLFQKVLGVVDMVFNVF